MKQDENRKLAYLVKVDDILEHTNADKLEIAKIKGWTCIVLKGQFKKGDLAVFFEIDSVLPPLAEFEFLEKRKYRIKTQRLRGELSQGLLMPIEDIKCLKKYSQNEKKLSKLDLDKVIGVTKYSPSLTASTGRNPLKRMNKNILETGALRIQNGSLSDIEATPNNVEISEKIDGQSTSFLFKDGKCQIMSHSITVAFYNFRTFELKVVKDLPEDKLRKIQTKYFKHILKYNLKCLKRKILKPFTSKTVNYILGNIDTDEILNNHKNHQLEYFLTNTWKFEMINREYDDCIIQGELIGSNVGGAAKNYYKLKDDELRFYIFNYTDLKNNNLEKEDLKELGFDIVPIINDKCLFKLIEDYNNKVNDKDKTNQEFLKYVNDLKSNINPDIYAEGIIILNTEKINTKSSKIKVISNNFLLREK